MQRSAPELFEHPGQLPSQPRHPNTPERFVFTVTEALHAIAVERRARLIEIELSPIDLHQVLDDLGRRRSFCEHEARHAREQIGIGNRRQSCHETRSSGRDGPFGPPPGQNPASGFPAGLPPQVNEVRNLFSLSDSLQESERASPILSWGRVSCSELSLGRSPSLHRLGRRYPCLRRLLRYFDGVRL